MVLHDFLPPYFCPLLFSFVGSEKAMENFSVSLHLHHTIFININTTDIILIFIIRVHPARVRQPLRCLATLLRAVRQDHLLRKPPCWYVWRFFIFVILVVGGVWWCVVVCGGVWWCVVVCGGVWWCVVVCGGVWWCVVVCGGVWWLCVGVCWCVLVCVSGIK